ncbi:hypothetical protein D3C78_532590 [compost metagenome]
MSIVRVFLGLLLAVLAACDGDKPEAPQPQAPARKEIQSPAPVAVPPPVAAPEAVESAPAAPPVEPPAATPEPARPAPRQPAVSSPPPRAAASAAPEVVVPLDLSLPAELLERLPGEQPLQQVVEPQPLLPPLFSEKTQPQSFELGGRLITNEGPPAVDEDSWHELEGAELELRFRR